MFKNVERKIFSSCVMTTELLSIHMRGTCCASMKEHWTGSEQTERLLENLYKMLRDT